MKVRIRATRSIIPNLFTLMNLFLGFTAIVSFAQNEFEQGALFILGAAVFDALDGVVARLTHSASDLGAELDSLCDAVSFGVAPSFMLYQAHFHTYEDAGILLAALPALAGVVRLARYNTELISYDDKIYFKGLPIPSAALLIVSYIIFFHLEGSIPEEYEAASVTGVSVIASLAMISRIKFDNMPRPTKDSFKKRPFVSVIFLLGVIGSAVTKGLLIFPFMAFYLIASAIRHFINWIKETRGAEDEIDESEDTSGIF